MITDRAYMREWRQRHRDHHVARPSNARHRCADCSVELLRGCITCSSCRKRRRNHPSITQE